MKNLYSDIKVGDLMTRDFISVSPDTNLKDCANMMIKKKVGSLIVKNKDELEGILTEKDIIWVIVKKSEKDLSKVKAKDIMKKKVVTIKPSATIIDALDKIREFKVRRLPIIEEKKVIGMLTLKDILKFEPNLYELIHETQKIREETQKLKTRSKYGSLVLGIKGRACDECGAEGIIYPIGNLDLCENCYNARKED